MNMTVKINANITNMTMNTTVNMITNMTMKHDERQIYYILLFGTRNVKTTNQHSSNSSSKNARTYLSFQV